VTEFQQGVIVSDIRLVLCRHYKQINLVSNKYEPRSIIRCSTRKQDGKIIYAPTDKWLGPGVVEKDAMILLPGSIKAANLSFIETIQTAYQETFIFSGEECGNAL